MPAVRIIEKIGRDSRNLLAAFGEFWRFVGSTLLWLGRGSLHWRNIRLIWPQMYEVGFRSVPVISITGAFIGMVLAVQAYSQFHNIGLETSMGAFIHMSVVRELGPVLAAVMLAGRVGSAMAAELATMRVTEQIDALACLGVDPVKYLGAPRFLACLVMIPMLTLFADLTGL